MSDADGPYMERRVFPTAYRSKHSKAVSFPVGAELLTRALGDVPQAGLITCDFYAGGEQQMMHRKESFLVLQANYLRRARSFFDGPDALALGALDPKWSISVFAVPLAHRHAIKTALAEALPTIAKDWFMARAAFGNPIGSHALWFNFDVMEQRLIVEEHGSVEPNRD